jgi:hypothetical protein
VPKRERRRAERRKRKARGRTASPTEFRERYRASSEARNQAAREVLEPLAAGERPRAVTVGAVCAGALSASMLVGYALGLEVNGTRPSAIEVLAPATLLGVMAVGMWRARYWAVLGFQAALVFILISASLGLIQATGVVQLVGTTLLIAATGTLFWFMVKAMARIQMPDSGPPGGQGLD